MLALMAKTQEKNTRDTTVVNDNSTGAIKGQTAK